LRTIDKLKIIEELTELPTFDKDKIKYEKVGNQSVKVIHPCGCFFIQHGLCGKPSINIEIRPELYKILQIDRQFNVELCKEHQNPKS
jgi:hypothetical protein